MSNIGSVAAAVAAGALVPLAIGAGTGILSKDRFTRGLDGPENEHDRRNAVAHAAELGLGATLVTTGAAAGFGELALQGRTGGVMMRNALRVTSMTVGISAGIFLLSTFAAAGLANGVDSFWDPDNGGW